MNVCRDGWISAASGHGTCSHHGGVAHKLPNILVLLVLVKVLAR
jgi:hypothetical protein